MSIDSSDIGSITRAIVDLGNQDETAAEKIWRRFFDQLCAFTQKRIGPRYRRHFDEDDVAASTFFVLFDGIKQGRFSRVRNREELWQLLTLIAARKTCNARKHHDRIKRGGGKVVGGSVVETIATDQLAEFLQFQDSPHCYQSVEETADELIQMLPDDMLKRIALLRLAGFSNAEIAEKCGCVTRTVERKLQLIRMLWSKHDLG